MIKVRRRRRAAMRRISRETTNDRNRHTDKITNMIRRIRVKKISRI
jgi:hypothetical protein